MAADPARAKRDGPPSAVPTRRTRALASAEGAQGTQPPDAGTVTDGPLAYPHALPHPTASRRFCLPTPRIPTGSTSPRARPRPRIYCSPWVKQLSCQRNEGTGTGDRSSLLRQSRPRGDSAPPAGARLSLRETGVSNRDTPSDPPRGVQRPVGVGSESPSESLSSCLPGPKRQTASSTRRSGPSMGGPGGGPGGSSKTCPVGTVSYRKWLWSSRMLVAIFSLTCFM